MKTSETENRPAAGVARKLSRSCFFGENEINRFLLKSVRSQRTFFREAGFGVNRNFGPNLKKVPEIAAEQMTLARELL